MALSDKRILEEREKGAIIIHPFNMSDLGTCSYDVRVGEYYYEESPPDPRAIGKEILYNMYDKDDVDRCWGTEAKKALPAREVLARFRGFQFTGIFPEDKIILLGPGQMILAHTEEFIGARYYATSMMKARSTIGRNFIEVCRCAGWGDVGYINRWTMEINNSSKWRTIPLVVGRRIAQIAFLETGDILNQDYVEAGGKYQTSTSLEEIIENWHPSMMLPRLYNDRDIKR